MNINIALLTVTDTRTFENDKSGAILVKKIEEAKHNLNDIHWCGGSSWVIQLGDQIDRCRPDDLVQN